MTYNLTFSGPRAPWQSPLGPISPAQRPFWHQLLLHVAGAPEIVCPARHSLLGRLRPQSQTSGETPLSFTSSNTGKSETHPLTSDLVQGEAWESAPWYPCPWEAGGQGRCSGGGCENPQAPGKDSCGIFLGVSARPGGRGLGGQLLRGPPLRAQNPSSVVIGKVGSVSALPLSRKSACR